MATKPFSGLTAKGSTTAETFEGEKHERQIWDDIKSFNIEALERKIAAEFQSVHADGARNKVGELELIKNLDSSNFTLSKFKVSQLGDTFVVTYLVTVEETLDAKKQPKRTTPRMSVWKKNGGEWQMIAHANLNFPS